MGDHSAKAGWGVKLGGALRYVRTHKAQVASLAFLAVGLISRLAPGFPADEVLKVVGALLGAS